MQTAASPKTRLLRMIEAYTGSWKGTRLFADRLVVGRNIDGAETPLSGVFQEEFEFIQLAKHLGPNRPVYGMRSCVGHRRRQGSLDRRHRRRLQSLSVGDFSAASEQAIHCRWKLSGRHICISASQKIEPDRARAFASGSVGVDFSYGRYLGSALLLYGEQSYTAEIYRGSRNCVPNWREDFPSNSAAGISGAHGHFFDDINIESLVRAIKAGDQGE